MSALPAPGPARATLAAVPAPGRGYGGVSYLLPR